MFFKIGVHKVAGLKVCNFIKERLQRSCFRVNDAKFLRAHFFTEHLQWLLYVSWANIASVKFLVQCCLSRIWTTLT